MAKTKHYVVGMYLRVSIETRERALLETMEDLFLDGSHKAAKALDDWYIQSRSKPNKTVAHAMQCIKNHLDEDIYYPEEVEDHEEREALIRLADRLP